MRSGFILARMIVLIFSAVGRCAEDREEVNSEDKLIEFKFKLRGGVI